MNIKTLFLICLFGVLVGCNSPKQASEGSPPLSNPLQEAAPVSILVLPPINNSVEIEAPAAILAHAIKPLAEWGYYVVPIVNMIETLQANGIHTAEEAHDINLAKLHEIFGADAVLYLTIKDYGSNYKVLRSEVVVSVIGQMVNVHTGEELWQSSINKVKRSDNSNSGLLESLVGAIIDQIGNSLTDVAYDLSAFAMNDLLRKKMVAGKYRLEFNNKLQAEQQSKHNAQQ